MPMELLHQRILSKSQYDTHTGDHFYGISPPDRFNSAAVGGAIGGVVVVLVGVVIIGMCIVILHRRKGNYSIMQGTDIGGVGGVERALVLYILVRAEPEY